MCTFISHFDFSQRDCPHLFLRESVYQKIKAYHIFGYQNRCLVYFPTTETYHSISNSGLEPILTRGSRGWDFCRKDAGNPGICSGPTSERQRYSMLRIRHLGPASPAGDLPSPQKHSSSAIAEQRFVVSDPIPEADLMATIDALPISHIVRDSLFIHPLFSIRIT